MEADGGPPNHELQTNLPIPRGFHEYEQCREAPGVYAKLAFQLWREGRLQRYRALKILYVCVLHWLIGRAADGCHLWLRWAGVSMRP